MQHSEGIYIPEYPNLPKPRDVAKDGFGYPDFDNSLAMFPRIFDRKTKEQIIREMAYAKWQDDGEPDGCDLEFWYAAEAEYEAAERLVNGW